MLLARLASVVDPQLPEEQAGFLQDHSTTQQISANSNVIQFLAREKFLNLVINACCFVGLGTHLFVKMP